MGWCGFEALMGSLRGVCRYSAYTRKNGDEVPAKLTDSQMRVVADYVLEQAKNGWQ
jgi:hypothetical protein